MKSQIVEHPLETLLRAMKYYSSSLSKAVEMTQYGFRIHNEKSICLDDVSTHHARQLIDFILIGWSPNRIFQTAEEMWRLRFDGIDDELRKAKSKTAMSLKSELTKCMNLLNKNN